MRELKFRFWDSFNECYTYSRDQKSLYGFFNLYEATEKGGNDPIIEQFTGLTDKNGKEVFEGDILKSNHFLNLSGEMEYLHHRVVWNKRYTGWQAVNMSEVDDPEKIITGSPQLWVYAKDEFEVIGNIHENKDLL